jgi:hypothetical protein
MGRFRIALFRELDAAQSDEVPGVRPRRRRLRVPGPGLVGGGLTHARASYDSIRGRIESDWKIEGGRFELSVSIPVNSEALVYVPGKLEESDGASVLREEEGSTVLSVGSGRYRFLSRREGS